MDVSLDELISREKKQKNSGTKASGKGKKSNKQHLEKQSRGEKVGKKGRGTDSGEKGKTKRRVTGGEGGVKKRSRDDDGSTYEGRGSSGKGFKKNRRDGTFNRKDRRHSNNHGSNGKREFKPTPRQQKEEFDFQPVWRTNHVAIQLDGVDLVTIFKTGKIVLCLEGEQNRYYLKAFNLVLKTFNLNIQPSGPRQWSIYDFDVPSFRQKFFDGCYVLDTLKSKERMRLRWKVINELYGREVTEEEDEEEAKPELEAPKPLDHKSRVWVKGDSEKDEAIVRSESDVPPHESSGPVFFLRMLCERKQWGPPEFTLEQNDDGEVGYSIKLSIFEDLLAPSNWFVSKSDAMVDAAREAVDLIKVHMKSQKE